MTRRRWLGILAAAALSIPVYSAAHEGHAHKVMGTIAARQDNHIDVRTRDGRTVTISVNEKTAVVRGKEKAGLEALKPGERVVVDVGNGKAPLTAREVKLGAASAATR